MGISINCVEGLGNQGDLDTVMINDVVTLTLDELDGPTADEILDGFPDDDPRTLTEIISDARCSSVEERLVQETTTALLAGRFVVVDIL